LNHVNILAIAVTLVQVPEAMAAYESQSEEEEMEEICATLGQSSHCLQTIQAQTRLTMPHHTAVRPIAHGLKNLRTKIPRHIR
jgi:phosphoribosylcarboxyaminoimidazole (NCAIR) mutase